jgi:hypothetical protein
VTVCEARREIAGSDGSLYCIMHVQDRVSSRTPVKLKAKDTEDGVKTAPCIKLTTCCGTPDRLEFRSNVKKGQAKNDEKETKTR